MIINSIQTHSKGLLIEDGFGLTIALPYTSILKLSTYMNSSNDEESIVLSIKVSEVKDELEFSSYDETVINTIKAIPSKLV